MHRSGTSLVANLLNKTGVFLGETGDLLPPNFDNRFGVYENLKLIQINNRILETFGLDWESTEAPDFNKKNKLPEQEELAQKLIRNLLSQHDVIGLKDPRTTVTLPFWRQLIDEDIKVLFVRRNPLEICDSLKKRNTSSKNKSLAIWENYTRQGLKNIEGLDTLIVNYDDILDNPFPNFVRMLKFLDIEYDKGTLKKMYFTLAPEIKHSAYSNKDFVRDKDVTDGQKDLLKSLDERYKEQLKKYPLKKVDIEVTVEEKNKHLRKKVSNMGEQLDKSRKELYYIKAEYQVLKKDIENKLMKASEKLTNQNEELTNQNEELTNQNEELTNQNEELTNQNEELTNQNEELTNQNNELSEHNKELNNVVFSKNKDLRDIYNSKSWKLTQPIREFAEIVRDLFKNSI
jgi:hypothetical protein